VRVRPLPAKLETELRAARRAELTAASRSDQQRAIAVTSEIIRAAVDDAGWHSVELVDALGIRVTAIRQRLAIARSRAELPAVLEVPLAAPLPPSPHHRRARDAWDDLLALPVDERDWLTNAEARRYVNREYRTLAIWRQLGLLPHTVELNRKRVYYSRRDLDQILAAPRIERGVDTAGTLMALRDGSHRGLTSATNRGRRLAAYDRDTRRGVTE
jgi:hypothetical protein